MITKLIAFYDKLKAKVIWFVKDWSEVWAFIPAAILFVYAADILRLKDETAGGYDIGYMAKFILALVFMLAVSASVWLGIRYNHPTVFKYGDTGFDDDWKNLTAWQRMRIYLLVPAVLFSLFVALIMVL